MKTNKEKQDLTKEVRDFLAFEHETSVIYPFAIAFEDVTEEMVAKISKLCNGCDDTETIYNACEQCLGINPLVNTEVGKRMVKNGIEAGVVRFIVDPNMESGTVCQIGEYWFYFGGYAAEEKNPEEFLKNADPDEVVSQVFLALQGLEEIGFCDEVRYYLSILSKIPA